MAGSRGFGVFVKTDGGSDPMFVLQHRAIEPNSPRPIDYNWPLSIVSEIGLQFCPWCGVRLKNWYRKVITELDRSDLAVHSLPLASF